MYNSESSSPVHLVSHTPNMQIPNRVISVLTFSSFPALNIVLTFHVATFNGSFFRSCFVVRISLDDDQEGLTSCPVDHKSTSAGALMAPLMPFTLTLLFASVVSKEAVGLVSCCLVLFKYFISLHYFFSVIWHMNKCVHNVSTKMYLLYLYCYYVCLSWRDKWT